MKISLISLPAPFEDEPAMNPPLGLSYISSAARNVTSDIMALDFSTFPQHDFYNSKDYLNEIPLSADVYCISCVTPQFHWLVDIIEHIKSHSHAKVVVGGPHASSRPEECLRVGKADYVVKGEGDRAIIDLLSDKDPALIQGLCYLKEGDFVNKTRVYIKNLDRLPYPDRDVFDLSRYKRKIYGYQAAHLVTLRGCPYNCAFCDKQSVGQTLRYRSVENVMDEIDLIIGQHGIRAFVIYDDIFTLSKDRLFEFCWEFKLRKLIWRCWSRADTLDREKLQAMKDAGLTSITIGIESGSNEILANIRKGITAEDNRRALLLCKELGVAVRCSLMYGNPGETWQTLCETIKLVRETQPDEWNLAILTPIPGSDIWNNPETYGVSFHKDLIERNRYKQLNRFGNTGIGNTSIVLDTMSEEEFKRNLERFVFALEEMCPRRQIQDTIQDIRL